MVWTCYLLTNLRLVPHPSTPWHRSLARVLLACLWLSSLVGRIQVTPKFQARRQSPQASINIMRHALYRNPQGKKESGRPRNTLRRSGIYILTDESKTDFKTVWEYILQYFRWHVLPSSGCCREFIFQASLNCYLVSLWYKYCISIGNQMISSAIWNK